MKTLKERLLLTLATDSSMSLSSKDSGATSSRNSNGDEKRRATVPDILKPQKSFEARYSHIINQQILETTINREALQRQINAFFPFGRSESLQKDAIGKTTQHVLSKAKAESTSTLTEEKVDELEEELPGVTKQNEDIKLEAAILNNPKNMECVDKPDM